MRMTMSANDGARAGVLAAGGAAILYRTAYPATAVALRSFTPIGIAALACTLALPVVIALTAAGLQLAPQAILGAALILIGIAGASGVLTRGVVRRLANGRDGRGPGLPEPDDVLPGVEQG